MALFDCPECGRKISDRAEACPQCGCPVGADDRPLPPGCYGCDALATSMCMRCGRLSCLEHLQPVDVPGGDCRCRELHCEVCIAKQTIVAAAFGNVAGIVLFSLAVIGGVIFYLSQVHR